ncbi:MAG: hypothetical protein H0U27_08270 [Nitrosopumilus sp.]|nr:hypothetical protein [Nitrosopumilus sp.]
MSLPPFVGTINPQFVWQNVDIPTPGGSPDPTEGFPAGTQGSIKNYDPYSIPINWVGSVPAILNGMTVDSLVRLFFTERGLDNYTLSVSNTYTVTSGTQYHLTNIPTLNFNIYDFSTTDPSLSTNIVPVQAIPGGSSGDQPYCLNTSCPSVTYNPLPDISGFSPQTLQVNPWNQGGVSDYGVSNFSLKAEMIITLTVRCQTGPELETSFCMSYCNDNLAICKPAFDTYCFAPGVTNIPLVTSNACQLYYEQLYRANGPDAQTDAKISDYCEAKYPPTICFNGLFNATPAASTFEINLCACHLPQECYDNYKKSLEIDAPGFVNYIEISGINERCLVSQCASSPFPSIDIGDEADTRCKVPACISVVNFQNNGSVVGGVTIDPSNTCQQIASGNNPNDPGSSRTWLWILIGVVILIIIIGVLVLLWRYI